MSFGLYRPKYSRELMKKIEDGLKKSDAEALYSDWEAIGNDFRKILPASAFKKKKK